MKNLDFTDLSPNEVFDLLALHTRWLSEQYKLGVQALPPEMVVAAFQGSDPQKTFFVNSGNTHLLVMAAATESMKTSSAPTPNFNMLGTAIIGAGMPATHDGPWPPVAADDTVIDLPINLSDQV